MDAPKPYSYTWHSSIKYLFPSQNNTELPGVDLFNYSDVRKHADEILEINKTKWGRPEADSFQGWINQGCNLGNNVYDQEKLIKRASDPSRLRKSLLKLNDQEKEDLKRAFRGMMAKNIDDPDSYAYLANIHGGDGKNSPQNCSHASIHFLPWHREYTIRFENAMRKVDGCSHVTLPYWDQNDEIPAILWEEPFKEYFYQREIVFFMRGEGGKKIKISRSINEPTKRISFQQAKDRISSKLKNFNRVLSVQQYERVFMTGLENIHNGFHQLLSDEGKLDMGNTILAAYDPIFWFLHADYDRLTWEWQRRMDAVNEIGLQKTFINRSDKTVDRLAKEYLDEMLKPWKEQTFRRLSNLSGADLKHNNEIGVEYTSGKFDAESMDVSDATTSKSLLFSSETVIKIENLEQEILIKNLNKTKIPGSFTVELFVQSKTSPKKKIDDQFILQAIDPDQCENCLENAIINISFFIPQLKQGDQLSIRIIVPATNEEFPLRKVGDPTIQILQVVPL